MTVELGDSNIHAKAMLSGMDSLTTMGLSQLITGPANCADNILDLVFCSRWEECHLRVEELITVSL